MAISKHLSFTTHIIACLLVSFLLLLSGCNQSDNAASSVPGSVQAVQEPANQTTQAPVKKSKTLTPQEELEKIFDSARANVSCAWEKGVLLAAGSDAGAYRVLHGQGLVDEYQIFCDLFGETEELKNRLKEGESVIRRKFQAEKFGS